MNHFSPIVLACALAIPVCAQDSKTNAADAKPEAPGQFFLASTAVVSAPLVFTNDCIFLPGDQAEVTNGGKAVFNFTVTNAGNYLVDSMVDAPDEASNSFFLNFDAQPTDPDMIWDIEVTAGFEKRPVSWRGNGDTSADQFSPKSFKLEPGAHTLIIVGREPGTLLKSLSIRPAPPE